MNEANQNAKDHQPISPRSIPPEQFYAAERREQAAPQASEPYAVLVFERGEEGPFDRKPVKPNSMPHLHAKRDPHYGYIELYTHPTQQGLGTIEDPKEMARWLLARRSHLGSCRDAAEAWCEVSGAKSWDNYTALAAALAAQAKQGEQANG
jgi:hypothetical protein